MERNFDDMGIKTSSVASEYIYGIVIAHPSGSSPNTGEFSFIVSSEIPHISKDQMQHPKIRQGQFCIVHSAEGIVLAKIEMIRIQNEYFTNAQTVKNFDSAQLRVQHYFPSDQWECFIADTSVLGVIPIKDRYSSNLDQKFFRKMVRPRLPVQPGNEVFAIDNNHLKELLGLDDEGLYLGSLADENLDCNINLNNLFNKHIAILAQSGAGKSYLLSVMLEELMLRDPEMGSPGMVLIDVHGEYRFMSQSKIFPKKNRSCYRQNAPEIEFKSASFFQIGTPELTEYDFKRYAPNITISGLRELRKAISKCRKSNLSNDSAENSEDDTHEVKQSENKIEAIKEQKKSENYSIRDLIAAILSDDSIKTSVAEALIGWLEDLDRTGLFGPRTYPSLNNMLRPGKLIIIDCSDIISFQKKQIIVHFIAQKLFNLRRKNVIAPYILFLEEAHNFLPENSGSQFYAKSILETISREGRKFFSQLVLISQRPKRLSTTALSQCNTHIIMRITNPNDLNHIKDSSESLTQETIRSISTLPTGTGLIMGAAVKRPIFAEFRQRYAENTQGEKTLSDISKQYNPVESSGMVIDGENTLQPTQIRGIQEDFITFINEE